MKSINDSQTKQEILKRIDSLSVNSKALWGKMNAGQMICHLGDQIKLALKYIKIEGKENFFTRNVVKNLIMLGMKPPKGKIETMPELNQTQGKGTQPQEFYNDKKSLILLIEEYCSTEENFDFGTHSLFGRMNKKQWGKAIYSHLDHHLTQFGV